MDKRYQIGIYYYFDNKWLGGLYYAQNLIMALNTLPDEKKPIINIYCFDEKSFTELEEQTRYPHLKINIIKESKIRRIWRAILLPFVPKIACNVNLFKISKEDKIIFPYGWGSEKGKLVYWMPDFQYKYFPQYFSKKELIKKDFVINSICERGIPVVFSSYDCQKDFRKFYPKHANHKSFVVHFAVNQPDFSDVKINEIKQKYGITGDYFICPNQFWKHKNHMFLFKAYKKAIESGLNLQLICTGRQGDDRNPKYIESIKDFINSNGLDSRIKLLGIIDKKELLCLIKNSYSAIQPSLFEGWNTTVEDCKKMNKFIFLSDIPVHREQISENVCFFDPHNEEDLVRKLLHVKPTESDSDYSGNIKEFADKFYSIIESFK